MKKRARVLLLVVAVSCSGQDRIIHEDEARGVRLRFTNTESIACIGDPAGAGGILGSYTLELSKPVPRRHTIPLPKGCKGPISFDASHDPIRLTCGPETYAVYIFADEIRALLGPAGEFRPLSEAADVLLQHSGRRLIGPILTEAHHQKQMVEVLVTLGDTDCGEWWMLSFDALPPEDQARVREGLRRRPGSSPLRDRRLKPGKQGG